ncbi:MAG: DUF2808 domain-containing protein, partial [Coleofasciculus sp. C2-GNP5-27]
TAPVAATPLSKGQTSLNRSPRLIRTATSYNHTSVPATYQFTIQVPEGAQPLQAVTITQKENAENIRFDVSESRAFMGNHVASGSELSLASVGGMESSSSKEVTVVFDQPVSPGNTVTVALKAKHNPRLDGIYLFGITAFPVGEDSPGLYLGSTRLNFYSD